MDFSNGEIHIFSASLDFSIGEIQSGAKPTDFSIGEIHHFMGQLPARWGSARPWGLGDGVWGYWVNPHPIGQPALRGNPPPWGLGDGLGVLGAKWWPERQGGGWAGRGTGHCWDGNGGGRGNQAVVTPPSNGTTCCMRQPPTMGVGDGLGVWGRSGSQNGGVVAGLAGAGALESGAMAVIVVAGTAGVVAGMVLAGMVEATGSVTTAQFPRPSPSPSQPRPAVPATAPPQRPLS